MSRDADDLERLKKRNAWLEAEYRRVCEELDFRDEKIRALVRALVRLSQKETPDAPAVRPDDT